MENIRKRYSAQEKAKIVMVIDPTENCTFWYNNEYISKFGEEDIPVMYKTYIAALHFQHYKVKVY